MSRSKRVESTNLLSASNTISLGTAISVITAIVIGVWYARGLVSEFSNVKDSVAYMRPIVDDMKASLDLLKSAAVTKKK